MTFTSVFGGTTVYPADVSYRAITLSANTTLDWPIETAPTGNIVAQIMDVNPTGAGFTIRMPSATEVSVGETALFFNIGSDAFVVADNSGNTIVSISPGLAWQVYLTDNTTVNGSWRSYQYGAGTSSANAGSLVGFGIKAIGATLNQSMPTISVSTNYTIGTADRASVVNWTGGAGTLTLLSASAAGNDWFVNIRNSGTGSITVQTSVGGQNVNGAPSIFLNPEDSAILFCDGNNFFTVGLGQSSAFSFDFISIDLTGQSTPYTLTGSELNRIAYRFVGNITGDVDVIVPSTVQQYWVSNETDLASDPFSVTIKTAAGTGIAILRNVRAILYCDGTNVLTANTGGIPLPLGISEGGTGATTASAARTNLGATSVGNALFTAVSDNTARATLGATTVGDAVFTAVDQSAARAAIGATTGTVTSVDVSGGTTGLTFSGGPVTTSGTITMAGTLDVASGGTGAATLTGVVIGNGTSAFTTVTAPSGTIVGTTDTQTLTNKTIAFADNTLTGVVGVTATQTLTNKTIAFADNTLTGVVGVTATQTLTNKTIERAILNDGYTEEVFAITDGSTVNLDPNNGSIQTWTLGANRTPGQANWAAGQSITLMVDDGSAHTITWSTLAVVWKTDGGTAPTLELTGFTVIVLWKVGTTIYGARVGYA
jgi:hypothetical protein